MEKIKVDFILDQYRSGVDSYADFTKEVGLWTSEKYVVEKYVKMPDHILDLGCGTGRTTFPLYLLGYEHILGVDLTPEMIDRANELNSEFETQIQFKTGDARKLEFAELTFDVVLFSFNGLMSIPGQKNRDKAIHEIYRVLKEDGLFIFTTHDRNEETAFLKFWEEDRVRWDEGKQNPQLYEFGDIIAKSKNESKDIFIHIPDKSEIENWLINNHFSIIDTFYRSDKFDESEAIKLKSGECRFWVAKKKSTTSGQVREV